MCHHVFAQSLNRSHLCLQGEELLEKVDSLGLREKVTVLCIPHFVCSEEPSERRIY